MLTKFYQSIKQRHFSIKARESIKNFLKKKMTESVNMLVNDIEIFLKKEKKALI